MSLVFNMVGGGSGGGDVFAFIVCTYPSGSTCTATNGTITLTAPDTSGSVVFDIPTPASTPETWTVACTDGTNTASTTVSISTDGQSVSVALTYHVPAEYQEVEYLESTGTQYIELPIYSSDIASGEIKYYIVTAIPYSFIFGSSSDTSSSTAGGTYGLRITSHDENRGFVYNGTLKSLAVNTVGIEYVVQFETTSGSQSYVINGGTPVTGTTSGTISQIQPNLFTLKYRTTIKPAENCKARVYYFSCFDSNGDIIMDLVPCYRKTDSVAGMWDRVSETFLTNAGSGTFTVGSDV